jgi:hypothetical protein
MKIVIENTHKTIVPKNLTQSDVLKYVKVLTLIIRKELWKPLLDLEVSSWDLIKQTNITVILYINTIILPLLDPEDVNTIPILKVAFYQFKQCHNPQGLNQELQNLSFSISSPLTTKHCGRYMLKVAPFIDLFVFSYNARIIYQTSRCHARESNNVNSSKGTYN